MKLNAYLSPLRSNAVISLLLVAGVFMLVGFACGGGPKDGVPPSSDYYGAWTGSDGSTIAIRGDGSGDYKSGGTSVSGGTVTISNGGKTLNINLFGLGPALNIDKPPANGQMTLGGVVYKKNGGGGTTTDTKPADKSPTPNKTPDDDDN